MAKQTQKRTVVGDSARMRTGRAPAYKPEMNRQAYRYALLGATMAQMAEWFEVGEQVIRDWMFRYPLFAESIRSGRAKADAEVAQRLYTRAMGFRHRAVKVVVANNIPHLVEYDHYYPPDVGACYIWLKNRQSDLWRDNRDQAPSDPEKAAEIAQAAIAAAMATAGGPEILAE